MSSDFTSDEIELLRSPHIRDCWFVEIYLSGGVVRMHTGIGRRVVDGKEWTGVTNPFSGVLVSIDGVEEPEFGQAAAVNITLSGADRQFFTYVRSIIDSELEGAPCEIYWTVFDQYEQMAIGGLKPLFSRGIVTAPTIKWAAPGLRTISLTIENIWTQMNYAAGDKWTAADHQRRFPGDLGCNFAGVKILENQK